MGFFKIYYGNYCHHHHYCYHHCYYYHHHYYNNYKVLHPSGSWAMEEAPQGVGYNTKPDRA